MVWPDRLQSLGHEVSIVVHRDDDGDQRLPEPVVLDDGAGVRQDGKRGRRATGRVTSSSKASAPRSGSRSWSRTALTALRSSPGAVCPQHRPVRSPPRRPADLLVADERGEGVAPAVVVAGEEPVHAVGDHGPVRLRRRGDRGHVDQRRLEELEVALRLAERVSHLEWCEVDVEAGQLARKGVGGHDLPPFDLLREVVEGGELVEVEPAPVKDETSERVRPQHLGHRGSHQREVPLMGQGPRRVADPHESVVRERPPGSPGQPGADQGFVVEAVRDHVRRLPEQPESGRKFGRRARAGVGLLGRASHLGEPDRRLPLGETLRPDAVDRGDGGEVGVDHQVVDVEEHDSARPPGPAHDPLHLGAPDGAPQEHHVGVVHRAEAGQRGIGDGEDGGLSPEAPDGLGEPHDPVLVPRRVRLAGDEHHADGCGAADRSTGQGTRPPALALAAGEVVAEGVEPDPADVGVRGEVPGGIEACAGVPALVGPVLEVVQEGIEAGGGDVGVGREVPGAGEHRVGVTTLPGAVDGVLPHGLDMGRTQVGVGGPVPVGVEQAGGPDRLPRGPDPPRLALPRRRRETTGDDAVEASPQTERRPPTPPDGGPQRVAPAAQHWAYGSQPFVEGSPPAWLP